MGSLVHLQAVISQSFALRFLYIKSEIILILSWDRRTAHTHSNRKYKLSYLKSLFRCKVRNSKFGTK